MIKQFYKPFILYGGIILSGLFLLFLDGKALSFNVIIAVFLSSIIFCGIIVGLGVYGVQVFLSCLHSTGIALEIQYRDVNWWGDYRIHIHSPAGLYRVESVIRQFINIRYNGPTTFGWKSFSLLEIRKAGLKEAEKLSNFSIKDTGSPSA